MTSERLEIRITGFGGQGVILSGHILGSAAAVYEGRFAALAQTYGPEARGSACRAAVIIADDPIDYPQVHRPQILIALSQDGYAQQRPHVDPRGLILIDEELVRPEALAALELPPIAHASAPATPKPPDIGHQINAHKGLGCVTEPLPPNKERPPRPQDHGQHRDGRLHRRRHRHHLARGRRKGDRRFRPQGHRGEKPQGVRGRLESRPQMARRPARQRPLTTPKPLPRAVALRGASFQPFGLTAAGPPPHARQRRHP